MTGCLLFNARKIVFLITGKNKTDVVYDIMKSGDTGPAATWRITPRVWTSLPT